MYCFVLGFFCFFYMLHDSFGSIILGPLEDLSVGVLMSVACVALRAMSFHVHNQAGKQVAESFANQVGVQILLWRAGLNARKSFQINLQHIWPGAGLLCLCVLSANLSVCLFVRLSCGLSICLSVWLSPHCPARLGTLPALCHMISPGAAGVKLI